MKEIHLTKGKVALVDDSDFEWLNQWRWYYNGGYAVRGYPKRILMHREILNTPVGYDTDHINRNKLDNRRENLRIATRSENLMNTGRRKDNKSGHKGVFWNKKNNNWRSMISFGGKRFEVGSFKTLEEAVKARNLAEKSYAV